MTKGCFPEGGIVNRKRKHQTDVTFKPVLKVLLHCQMEEGIAFEGRTRTSGEEKLGKTCTLN